MFRKERKKLDLCQFLSPKDIQGASISVFVSVVNRSRGLQVEGVGKIHSELLLNILNASVLNESCKVVHSVSYGR